jgi:hypothetical protein
MNPLQLLLVVVIVFTINTVHGSSVVISEVMYNSPIDESCEFIELHNASPERVSLAGWSIPAVGWTWPTTSPAALDAGAYGVVAKNRTQLLRLYALPQSEYGERVWGDYSGALNNGGERVALFDGAESEVDWVEYGDAYPWPALADGLGSSLERLCVTADERGAGNWIASPAPQTVDLRSELSGSPLKASSWAQCPPLPYSTASQVGVHVSEIHYHAVGENLMREQFEFVELWNRGLYDYDLSHHRLHGKTLRYRFPTGTVLSVGARVVVSPNPPALIAAYANHSAVKRALGPYDGELGNGRGELVLLDDNGREIERVRWDDAFPWPHAADALGGSDDWLDAGSTLKGKAAAYWARGQSLHRLDYTRHRSATQPWAWIAADATPSRDAPADAYRWPATPHWVAPIVVELDARARGAQWPAADETTWVRARTEPWPAPHVQLARVECRYYRDELYDDSKRAAARKAAATVPAAATENGAYECAIPPQAANAVVRYQVLLYYDDGASDRSPRAADPYQWHSFFVPPAARVGESDAYHVFIGSAAWGDLIRNTRDGRVEADGCTARNAWNAERRVTLVHNGAVVEARARHQGSRYNRQSGEELSLANWTARGYVGPDLAAGEQFQALSWRFKLPPWARVRGRRELILNKMRNYCTFFTAPLHFGLAERAGLWGHATRMVQLHVNGGYFRYMLEIDRPGEDSMADWLERVNRRCPNKPTLGVAHLFKAQGCACDEGPYGFGTMKRLDNVCNYTAAQRYEYTYARKTHNGAQDATHAAFIRLVDELNGLAVGENDAACQAWFARNFDVNLMLTYMALASWAGVWDDNIHNWYALQRLEDGKWFWVSWDADALYGEYAAQGKTFNATLYEGDGDDIFQKQIGVNVLKTAFMRCHRRQLNQRFADLQASVLTVDSTDSLLADAQQTFYDRDFRAAFGAYAKAPVTCNTLIKKYLVERYGWVQAELSRKGVAAPRALDVCPDVPDIARRDYNRFYAPGGLALSAFYGYLGHVYVGWAEPRAWIYSSDYQRGRRRQAPAAAAAAAVLFARGSELSYSTASQPAGWQADGFNYAAWPKAKAPLGYDPRQPTWQFGGDVPRGAAGLWVRATVTLSAAQLSALVGSTLLILADNAADIWFNEKLVSNEASASRNHDAEYWNAQVQLGRAPWRVGVNHIAAYVTNVGDPDDLAFDLEVTWTNAQAPSATPSEELLTPYGTVATVTAPAPTPAGTPYKYEAVDRVLEKAALPGSPVDADVSALQWAVVHSSRDQWSWTDADVAEGKWYAYRLTVGSAPPAVQLVRAATASDALQSGAPAEPAAADLTVLWIVLGVLGALALVGGAAFLFVRNSRGSAKRAQNVDMLRRSSAIATPANDESRASATFVQPATKRADLVGGWDNSVSAIDVQGSSPRVVAAAPPAAVVIPSDRAFDAPASPRAELVGGWAGSTRAYDAGAPAPTIQRVLSAPVHADEPLIAYSVGAPNMNGVTGTYGDHQCEICGNRYPIADDKEIHKRRRHPDDPRTNWPQGKPHLIVSPSSPAGIGGGGGNFY